MVARGEAMMCFANHSFASPLLLSANLADKDEAFGLRSET
jgi:hypothetical protein